MPYNLSTQQTIFEQLYCGVTVPNPALDRVCLLRPGLNLSNDSSRVDFISNELIQDVAYNRVSPYLKVESLNANGTFTITDHGLSNGAKVFALFELGASLGVGINPGIDCYVIEAGTNTLKISLTPGGTGLLPTLSGAVYLCAAGGSLDVNANRFTAPSTPINIVASGGTLSYQGYFILRNADPIANQVVSVVSTSTGQFSTASAHGLVLGDEVVITADSGGTLPGGILSSKTYYIQPTATNGFALYNSASDAVASTNRIIPSSPGTGTIRVRYATGYVESFEYYPTPVTVNDGMSRILRLNRSNRGA